MQKNALAVMAVIAILSSIGSAVWPFPDLSATDSGTPESIAIGTPPHELNALIYIAKDQNFFAANGLNVTIKDYDSGLDAVNGILNGDVDMAMASEFVIVGKALEGRSIRDIACISKSQNEYLVGQTNMIQNVSDIRGKRIGVSKATAAEFYLGRFLNLHGINPQQVTLVDIKASQAADAITDGKVDAALTWQPHVNEAKERLGNGTFIWPAQSSQDMYWNAICADGWASKHPDLINRFLKSLSQAEDYYSNHPDNTEAIVQKRLHYNDSYIAIVWPENRFSLSLDQSLIAAMEDEARWMIQNNLTTGRTVPDFTDFIYTKGLEVVKPEAVNIR